MFFVAAKMFFQHGTVGGKTLAKLNAVDAMLTGIVKTRDHDFMLVIFWDIVYLPQFNGHF